MTMLAHEIVYSPDDGGYWINQIREDFKSRASIKIYATRAEAERAIAARKVRFEAWRD